MATWLGQHMFVKEIKFCLTSRQSPRPKLQRIQSLRLRCSLSLSRQRGLNVKRIGDRDNLAYSGSSSINGNTNGSQPSSISSTPLGVKRTDIQKILVLGAGPIVIGQACEFDYSGTQACKALKEEGYSVVLLNSNPATIMTDPETADRTYVCPMTVNSVEEIIGREKPQVILPTMGGQTALNLAIELSKSGVLEKYGVELIGAKLEAIEKAEDRKLFNDAMEHIGLKTPPSGTATTMEEAREIASQIGSYPLIIRPAFTLGGTGGGIAYNKDEFEEIVASGLEASRTSQVLIDKSLLGWKEYELEVMRDLADNVVIVCGIENLDPMGVHTGDSITIAPIQTLTDKEYQKMRDAAIAIIREIGVECGGSNVQFAINPENGDLVVIEMNPRVSRSSALASKATGFPIAKIAAKLAVGLTLDKIMNDITGETPACFEPSIDYVVTKIPRFAFEKFPGTSQLLTTQMKSVGEAMAFGRTFQESFQKCLRSLEIGRSGLSAAKNVSPSEDAIPVDESELIYNMRNPNPERVFFLRKAMKQGYTIDDIYQITAIDKWFLKQIWDIVQVENFLRTKSLDDLTGEEIFRVKQMGFSDAQIAWATECEGGESVVRRKRIELGVLPSYKRVDTCAAEFAAETPYLYSTYESECESFPTEKKKVLILGGGPNRIGQGIEFDYCCCHASYAIQSEGIEAIIMNSNPETVSTDYDTSDRLYFEPLTLEDVLSVVAKERPMGIIVQFGGQTPLKLALSLDAELKELNIPAVGMSDMPVKIIGTSPSDIDAAEDRARFEEILRMQEIRQPKGVIANSVAEAIELAAEVGFPLVVRPSYVLGGRAMEIVYSSDQLSEYVERAAAVDPDQSLLLDKYLEDAIELDVDCLADREGGVVIGGIMEHIEQAGVHSGDSACSLPTQSISPEVLSIVKEWSFRLAKELHVEGLMNVQYAIKDEEVYVLEANPRASRTVPFVSKAIGKPLAQFASLLMLGKTLEEVGFTEEVIPMHVAIKEAVLPFDKFSGADTLLGPEMRSTGEVMGIDADFQIAVAKALVSASQKIPTNGSVFVSMNDRSKEKCIVVVNDLIDEGFKIVATSGTANFLSSKGIPCETVLKLHEGRPHAGDLMANGEINLMIITSSGDILDQEDGRKLRRQALACKVPIVTTLAGANATVAAVRALKNGVLPAVPIQEYHSL